MMNDKSPRKVLPRGPTPRMGPGLFANPQATASAQRAIDQLSQQADALAIQLEDVEALREKLEHISENYWADHRYDHQTSFADMKGELKPLRRDIQALHNTLNGLTRSTKAALNAQYRRIVSGDFGSEHLAEIQARLEVLEKASNRLLALKLLKTPAVATAECCLSLWRFRESLTGRPFTRSWQSAKGKTGLEFVSADARFVQVAMAAIDPKIGFSQVRSTLTRCASSPARKK